MTCIAAIVDLFYMVSKEWREPGWYSLYQLYRGVHL